MSVYISIIGVTAVHIAGPVYLHIAFGCMVGRIHIVGSCIANRTTGEAVAVPVMGCVVAVSSAFILMDMVQGTASACVRMLRLSAHITILRMLMLDIAEVLIAALCMGMLHLAGSGMSKCDLIYISGIIHIDRG